MPLGFIVVLPPEMIAMSSSGALIGAFKGPGVSFRIHLSRCFGRDGVLVLCAGGRWLVARVSSVVYGILDDTAAKPVYRHVVGLVRNPLTVVIPDLSVVCWSEV